MHLFNRLSIFNNEVTQPFEVNKVIQILITNNLEINDLVSVFLGPHRLFI